MDRTHSSGDPFVSHGRSARSPIRREHGSLSDVSTVFRKSTDDPRSKGASGMLRHCLHADKIGVEIVGEVTKTDLFCVILSEWGICVRASRPLPEQRALYLRLSFPHSAETIDVKGEVRPMSLCGIDTGTESGAGILFVDPSDKVRRTIRNFIEWEMADVAAWEPDPAEFKMIEDLDVLVLAALGCCPEPESGTLITRFPASPQMENALKLSLRKR